MVLLNYQFYNHYDLSSCNSSSHHQHRNKSCNSSSYRHHRSKSCNSSSHHQHRNNSCNCCSCNGCCEKRLEPKPHCPQQTCQQSLNELLASVAVVENSLANAVNSVSNSLKENNLTEEQVTKRINQLEDVLKLVIKKEIILEFLIEEATKACQSED